MKSGDARFPVLSSWLASELERRGFSSNPKLTRARREENGVLQMVERYIGQWGWYIELGAHPLIVDRDFAVGRPKPLKPRKVNECLFQQRLLRRSVPFRSTNRERWDDELSLLGEELTVRNVQEAFSREFDSGLFSMSAAELTNSDIPVSYGFRGLASAVVLHHDGLVAEARNLVERCVATCTGVREREAIEETAAALRIGTLSWPASFADPALWPDYSFAWAMEVGRISQKQSDAFRLGEFKIIEGFPRRNLAGVELDVQAVSAESFRLIVRAEEFSLASSLIKADLERLEVCPPPHASLFVYPIDSGGAWLGLRLEVMRLGAEGPAIELGFDDGGRIVVPEQELQSAFDKLGVEGDDELELRFTWDSV